MKYDPERFNDWERVPFPEMDNVAFFVKPQGEGNGFEFVVLEGTEVECVGGSFRFFIEPTEVEILIHGTAMFDGVRHLYFGSEETGNYGYHYYPKLSILKLILEKLQEQVLKYCTETGV